MHQQTDHPVSTTPLTRHRHVPDQRDAFSVFHTDGLIRRSIFNFIIYVIASGALIVLNMDVFSVKPFTDWRLLWLLWTMAYWPSLIALCFGVWLHRLTVSRWRVFKWSNTLLMLVLIQIGLSFHSDWSLWLGVMLEIILVYIGLSLVKDDTAGDEEADLPTG